MSNDYGYIIGILEGGSEEQLEELALLVDGFPEGRDDFINRRWITNAIDCGSKRAIEWMLLKGVDLSFRDEEGYTALLSAIDREQEDKYEILELLLKRGAPTDVRGINDWTPLHMAAAQNDVKALKCLVKFGADLTARTTIDNYATPLEEAKILGSKEAERFLESVTH